MKLTRNHLAIIAVAASLTALAGCNKNESDTKRSAPSTTSPPPATTPAPPPASTPAPAPAPSSSSSMDGSASGVTTAGPSATDKLKADAKRAGGAIADTARDAKDATKEAARNAGQAIREGADKADKAIQERLGGSSTTTDKAPAAPQG